MSVRGLFSSLALLTAVMASPALAADLSGARARFLATALAFDARPGADELYQMPVLDRTLVADRLSDLTEIRGCRAVQIGGEPWPECTVSWTTPRDGAGRTSWLELGATLTPTSEFAAAYLLERIADSPLPTAELVEEYQRAERPAGLGWVSFVIEREEARETLVRLQRGNLVLTVRGHGDLRRVALPTAFALDESLLADHVALDAIRAEAHRLLDTNAAQASEGARRE